jgi:uncharacterized membrane protein
MISKGRFEGFSDGVFAIAITLLVLEFRVPDLPARTDAMLSTALLALWPQYLVYVASFATIGIMWFNHYALFHGVRTISYSALIANLVLLLLVCFLPFPTAVLGRYGLMPAGVAYYGLTLLGLSICFNVLYYSVTLRPGQRGSVVGFCLTRNVWNTIGIASYALGTLSAWLNPLLAIVLFAVIAVYYMLPGSVRGALAASGESAASN